MMVEPDVLFIHIPKTGGVSVREVLGSRMVAPPYPHPTAAIYRETVGEKKFDETLKLTVVRHPCDRMASLYYWITEMHEDSSYYPGTQDQREIMARYSCFKEFVLCVPRDVLINTVFQPLSYFLDIDGRSACDLVLRYEQLDAEWSSVAEAFGFTENLPRKNVTPKRPDWMDAFNPAMLCRMRAVYGADAARYGYVI